MAQAFFPLRDYPELEPLRECWELIRREAQEFRADMVWVEDDRTAGRVWQFAPLQPEEEDRDPVLDELSHCLRRRANESARVVGAIPGVLAYGFSLLLGGATIGIHQHANPFVTAMLGLAVGDRCWITVGQETEHIRAGHMLIFDYTLPHTVVNESKEERLVLLVLLPNKSR